MSREPMMPGEADLSTIEPPGWPSVVGTISIVWGLVGIMCAGCGLLGPMLSGAFLPPEMMNPPPPFTRITPEMLLSVGISLVVTFVLIAAGVATVGRRRAGRTLHLLYVALSVVSIAVGVMVQIKAYSAMTQWVQQNPDHPIARQMGAGGGVGQWIGMAFGMLIGIAYPLFCVVWFGFMGRKPDEGQDRAEEA
jgi:hypothetical protein